MEILELFAFCVLDPSQKLRYKIRRALSAPRGGRAQVSLRVVRPGCWFCFVCFFLNLTLYIKAFFFF